MQLSEQYIQQLRDDNWYNTMTTRGERQLRAEIDRNQPDIVTRVNFVSFRAGFRYWLEGMLCNTWLADTFSLEAITTRDTNTHSAFSKLFAVQQWQQLSAILANYSAEYAQFRSKSWNEEGVGTRNGSDERWEFIEGQKRSLGVIQDDYFAQVQAVLTAAAISERQCIDALNADQLQQAKISASNLISDKIRSIARPLFFRRDDEGGMIDLLEEFPSESPLVGYLADATRVREVER